MPFTPSPALLNKFRQMSLERLERVDDALLKLADNCADEQVRKLAGRELHSLKGEAGMMGFEGVFEVARALEGLFSAAHRGRTQEPSCTQQLRGGMELIRRLLPDPPAPVGPEAEQFVGEAKGLVADVDGA